MANTCEPEQKIHPHCFHGTANQVDRWRKTFPNTYFSFSLEVKNFHDEQKTALCRVPSHRLLLETERTQPQQIQIFGLITRGTWDKWP